MSKQSHKRDEHQLSPDAIVEPSVATRTIDLGDEVVILDVLGDRVYRLNTTGALIWRALRHQRVVVADVVEQLRSSYGLDSAKAHAATAAYLGELSAEGLIGSTIRREQSERTENQTPRKETA
jgi:hypothetical protein